LEVKELIQRCLLGNQDAEKLLFSTFVTPMGRLCIRYLKDSDLAQDVLMEGFIKVYKNLKHFTYLGEQSLEVWIRKIMINECLMNLRKRKADLFMAVDNEHLHIRYEDEDNLQTEDITDMIKSLPKGYRTIFNLYAIDGYSHKEISDMLGITESASRSQLTHARAILKELLIKHGWK
jgi:RNA polymerase sigma factor (sigma-70 family)